MTNTISDIETADVILVTGSNTTENHPVLSAFIKRAVTFRGAKLIVVDPRFVRIAKFAHHWLRQKLGTDVAWINGMMNVIINENIYDSAFVEKRTEGFEELKERVREYSAERAAEITGLARSTIGRGLNDLDTSGPGNGRVRRKGGGRREVADLDATLVSDLQQFPGAFCCLYHSLRFCQRV